MDIAEKIMAIKTEIIDEVKADNSSQIEAKRQELENNYENFQQDLKTQQESILKSYQSQADQKREQIISRAILNKKNKRRSKLNECLANFITELEQRLADFTSDQDYYLFIFNSIKNSASALPDNRFKIWLRKADQNLLDDLKNSLELEMKDYEFELSVSDRVKSGGFIIETCSNQQLIENTFAALIDSYKEEIAIELKNHILE